MNEKHDVIQECAAQIAAVGDLLTRAAGYTSRNNVERWLACAQSGGANWGAVGRRFLVSVVPYVFGFGIYLAYQCCLIQPAYCLFESVFVMEIEAS